MSILEPTRMRFRDALEGITLLTDVPRWQCTDCGFTPETELHRHPQKCPRCAGDQYGHRASGIHSLQVRVGRHDYPVLHPLELAELGWPYRLRAGRPPQLDMYRTNAADNEAAVVRGKPGAWDASMRDPWAACLIAGGESAARARQLPGSHFKELPLVRIGVDAGAEREPVDIAFSVMTDWEASRIDWRTQGIRRLLVASPNVSPAAVRQAESVRWVLPQLIDPHTSALRAKWSGELHAVRDEVQKPGGGSSLLSAMDWCVRHGAVVLVIYGAEGIPELGAGLAGALAAWCFASGVFVADESGGAFDDTEGAYETGFMHATRALQGAAHVGVELPESAWAPRRYARGAGPN